MLLKNIPFRGAIASNRNMTARRIDFKDISLQGRNTAKANAATNTITEQKKTALIRIRPGTASGFPKTVNVLPEQVISTSSEKFICSKGIAHHSLLSLFIFT
jgi:hypothetical protein